MMFWRPPSFHICSIARDPSLVGNQYLKDTCVHKAVRPRIADAGALKAELLCGIDVNVKARHTMMMRCGDGRQAG
jgi:hypothetical protein